MLRQLLIRQLRQFKNKNMLNSIIIKKILTLVSFLILAISLISFSKTQPAFAGAPCSNGGCYDNIKCVWVVDDSLPAGGYYTTGTEPCGSAVIGGVAPPPAIANINRISGNSVDGSGLGVLLFFSRALNFGAIVGGIIVVGNFIGAGLMYVTGAGNSETHVKVMNKITYSVIGIIIIVSTYTIVGLIGLIFFKDPAFLLKPNLYGVR